MDKEKTVAIVLIVVLSLGLLGWLEYRNNQVRELIDSEIGYEFDSSFDSDFKESFVDGCMEGDEDFREYCECGYKYISARADYSEMLKLADELYKGNMPDILMDSVQACWYLID